MELPVHLKYERSITPEDVCCFSVWPNGQRLPLRYEPRTTLGMHEGMAAAYSAPGKINHQVSEERLAQGNPHEIDFCNAPYGISHIEFEFTVSFSSELRKPCVCSDRKVKSTLVQFVNLYESKIGWEQLVARYLFNICSGKWLWRNTRHAYSVDIELSLWPLDDTTVRFLNVTRAYPDIESFRNTEYWAVMLNMIIDAFSHPQGLAILEMVASLKLPKRKSLHPSQVFKESKRGENNRIYQSTIIEGDRSPIIGCYKAGAAIATIDDWYPDAEEPIRISHYGVSKQDVACYRHPSTGKDLFSLLQRTDEFVELLSFNDAVSLDALNDMHFLIANIIKGGLFQRTGS